VAAQTATSVRLKIFQVRLFHTSRQACTSASPNLAVVGKSGSTALWREHELPSTSNGFHFTSRILEMAGRAAFTWVDVRTVPV